MESMNMVKQTLRVIKTRIRSTEVKVDGEFLRTLRELSATSVTEFCILEGISGQLYQKLRKVGLGPKTMSVGGLIRISRPAREAWERAREGTSPETLPEYLAREKKEREPA
jgi:hypothetical protein